DEQSVGARRQCPATAQLQALVQPFICRWQGFIALLGAYAVALMALSLTALKGRTTAPRNCSPIWRAAREGGEWLVVVRLRFTATTLPERHCAPAGGPRQHHGVRADDRDRGQTPGGQEGIEHAACHPEGKRLAVGVGKNISEA